MELLQRRVSRMVRMEEAIERQQAAERAQRDSMQRRLLNCALAVRCTARACLSGHGAEVKAHVWRTTCQGRWIVLCGGRHLCQHWAPALQGTMRWH